MEDLGTIFYQVDAKTEPLVNSSTKAYKALDQLEANLAQTDRVAASTAKTLNTSVKSGLDAAGSGFSNVSSKAKDAGRSVGNFAGSVNAVKGSAAKGIVSTAASIEEAAKASDDATDPLKKLAETMADGSNNANTFSFSMSALAKAIAAVALSGVVAGIAEMVQKYQEMAERVQMATSSTEEFNDVQARLLNTANGTYRSLQEAQELYISTANSLRSMGYSTQQALDVTDSMSFAFVKNATSADKAQAAIDGFSKSINTGKVAADQWETITSAIPSVIGDIATASGKTSAEIRKLGAEGKLTAAQLTEGLRKSLDANAKAAADMSNNFVDAAVRTKTAVTSFFVAVEQQTGVLQNLTDGIIMAADNLLRFGSNSDGVATAITAVSSSAAVLAAVITGRLVGAMSGYITTKAVLLSATLAQITADQSAAASNLMLARANEASAAAALTAARAAEAAAVGFAHHATMANALAVAQSEATLATQQLNAALAANAGVATRAGLAIKGLQTVMTFLGGPVGVILIAAAALYYFSKAAGETKVNVDQLNQSLGTLTFNQLSRSANEVGDDIEKLNKRLSAAYSDFNTLSKRPWETNDDFTKRQTEARAAIDDVNKELEARRAALVKIADAQEKIKNRETPQSDPNVTPTLPEDADSAKVIKGLQDQRDLLKEIGVKRAELAATQKLGDEATPKQVARAKELAAEIYNLEQAEAKQKSAKKKGESEAAAAAKKAATEQRKGVEDNQKAFAKLGDELASVNKTARELAMDQAQLSLNKYATPEQVQTIRDVAGALYDLKGAKELLAQVDPIAAQQMSYQDEVKALQDANNQKLISDQRYQELKHAGELANAEKMKQLQEENFKSQAIGNEILLNSIDALGQGATTAIAGLVSGTGSLQEALSGIANTVLNTVVGAFVQMGVDWVKQQIMMQAAAASTTAVQTAGIGTVAAVQAGATGAIAATTTTAAATTGTAVAASMAPAAGLSSIASFGGAAVIGGAALLATMLLAKSFGGGRRAGGAVNPGSVYRVNEGGAPEIFTAGGQQYMIPNQRGQVVNNREASAGGDGGGGSAAPIVNIYEAAPGTSVKSTFSEADRTWVIDVVNGDMASGGKTGQTANRITGTKRAGQ